MTPQHPISRSVRRVGLAVLYGIWLLPAFAFTQPPAFTNTLAGAPPDGWENTRVDADVPITQFAIVTEGARQVLAARSDAGASSLVHTLSIAAPASSALEWQWKVSNAVPNSSITQKSTDDYAARVYVFFDYDRAKLSFADRVKIDLARTVYGAKIPTAALCYVWGDKDAVGTIGPNPYTDRVRMIVLQRGDARAGQWVSERRDLAADFEAAFGEAAPPVTGLAVGADTDNTGARVEARFSDIRFEAPPN